MSHDWAADQALAAEVSRFYDLALETYRRNPLLLREHVGQEESLRTGGYSTRTLQELIQNGADAAASQPDGGRIEVVLTPDALYCANDGAPFDLAGVRALTHAYLSEKRGDEIGRFGLGFKSTLAISSAPQIFSQSVSFGFGGARARGDLAQIAGRGLPIPVLRTAELITPALERAADPVLDRLAKWATTVVRLPNIKPEDHAHLERQMQDFNPEFLLFTEGVSKLTMSDSRGFNRCLSKRLDDEGFIEILDGESSHARWIVAHRMHESSRAAQAQVGSAVARESVRISVAVPEKQSALRVGEFWAYFPLADEQTTASGIFNAPWSLNDDRTTLLENDYNREILVEIADLFAETILQLATAEDPARHFDYLTARGRESRSFGDRLLTEHIPTSAVRRASVPDARGQLRTPGELQPLNFNVLVEDMAVLGAPDTHQAWQQATLTRADVPHFRCYSDTIRRTRLQRLFAESALLEQGESIVDVLSASKVQALLTQVPSRHLSEWLTEWASGSTIDAANALKIALQLKHPDSRQIVKSIPLIPTMSGYATLSQASMVFLERVEGINIEGAQFVLPEFLNESSIRRLLAREGFRQLDAAAILRARIGQLPDEPESEDWESIWDAMMDLTSRDALKLLQESGRKIKVPTMDGGWEWPKQVFDIEHSLGADLDSRRLDRRRCIPEIAHSISVTSAINGKVFPFKNEPCAPEYETWVINHLNARKHPDQAPLGLVDYEANPQIGPASILLLLGRNDAPHDLRTEWTQALLNQEFAETWSIDNVESGETYYAPSFQSWILSESGIATSTLGAAPVRRLLSKKLFRFSQVFPVAISQPRSYSLPDTVDQIPAELLQEFLKEPRGAESLDDQGLSELIATAIGAELPTPTRLPSRVGRAVEVHLVSGITLTQTEEEREFVLERFQPYLHVNSEEQLEALTAIGCVPFEEGFSFSIEFSGRGSEALVLDMFTGLRGQGFEQLLRDARIVRVETLAKRVETKAGVSDENHAALRDGSVLYAKSELSDHEILSHLNDLFELGLSSQERLDAQQATLNNRLMDYQSQARAARDDADRLNVLFGPEELRDILPSGLWDSLAADGSVNSFTDVAELVLDVYGNETLKRLQTKFDRLGFRDVPTTWAGNRATMDWVRKFGFDEQFAGESTPSLDDMFVVPGAVELHEMHDYQKDISEKLASVLTLRNQDGKAQKAMVELPTGAGKTRVAAETALRLLRDRAIRGSVLWIAQSQELCEQAVQTFNEIWRGLRVPEPLTIGRLWSNHEVEQPSTELSVIVAVDAKLDSIIADRPDEYEWLSEASAVFVDEGHRAGDSPRYTRILTWLGVGGRQWERPLVGLSATPFRGRSEESTLSLVNRFGGKRLSAFEEDSYQPLVDRGVLAKVKHEILGGTSLQLNAADQREIAGWNRFSPEVLTKVAGDKKRMSRLVDHILSLDPTWPILVFAPTVLSAQVLAARLKIKKVAAESISGETGAKERRRIIERFRSGATRVLTNCDLLTAGFDAPQVRALYVAKPTLSPNAYIQMVGRGLRGPKNGGKEECLIVDLQDNFDGLSGGSLAYTEFDYLWEERR